VQPTSSIPQPPSTTDTPSTGLSSSDKINLGTGIGVGLGVGIPALVLAYLGYKKANRGSERRKNQRAESLRMSGYSR